MYPQAHVPPRHGDGLDDARLAEVRVDHGADAHVCPDDDRRRAGLDRARARALAGVGFGAGFSFGAGLLAVGSPAAWRRTSVAK